MSEKTFSTSPGLLSDIIAGPPNFSRPVLQAPRDVISESVRSSSMWARYQASAASAQRNAESERLAELEKKDKAKQEKAKLRQLERTGDGPVMHAPLLTHTPAKQLKRFASSMIRAESASSSQATSSHVPSQKEVRPHARVPLRRHSSTVPASQPADETRPYAGKRGLYESSDSDCSKEAAPKLRSAPAIPESESRNPNLYVDIADDAEFSALKGCTIEYMDMRTGNDNVRIVVDVEVDSRRNIRRLFLRDPAMPKHAFPTASHDICNVYKLAQADGPSRSADAQVSKPHSLSRVEASQSKIEHIPAWNDERVDPPRKLWRDKKSIDE